MESRQSLKTHLAGLLSSSGFNWRVWLPSRGNVLFTLVIVFTLFWAQSANALPWKAPAVTDISTHTWPYQGRLADKSGNPIQATVSMIFRLYGIASGGTPLWEEQWTGPNSVQVSDGLFNVMLGSLTPIPQDLVSGNGSLWLGITAGTDDEMTPRIQLGSVPFAVQALTVPDGSITAAKLAEGAFPPGVPVGTVISWWRATADTPLPSGEWAIANGGVVNDPESPLNGKTLPDLTNRFVMGITTANIGELGGNNTLNLAHSHIIPNHTHTIYHDHNTLDAYAVAGGSLSVHRDITSVTVADSGSWGGTTDLQLSGSTDNRPQYIGLIYIIRIK